MPIVINPSATVQLQQTNKIIIGVVPSDLITTTTTTTTTSTTTSSTTTTTAVPCLSYGTNFASTSNGATLGGAVVDSGNVSSNYFGPNAYSTSMATSSSWTAVGSIFTGASETNTICRSVKNASSGSTFSGGGSSSSPFNIVIDLGQNRTFNHARYYQMFSDGKATHAALDVSSDGNLNTITSPNWTQVHAFSLLDNSSTSTGIGVDFSNTTARYLRIRVYNDGRYLNSSYTELYNFKLFYKDEGSTTTPVPTTTTTPVPTTTTTPVPTTTTTPVPTTTTTPVPTTPPPVTSGLTLWYKAEGYTSGSQTWTDNSTTNNTGTFIGTPPVYSTSPNKLSFVSSSGNQVTSINSFGLNANPWTISTWFRTFSPSGRKIIGMENVVSGGNATAFDSHIYVGTDGRLRYGIYEGGPRYLISPDVVTDNMFRNVTVTLGSGIGSMYINNQLVSSGSMTAGLYSGYWRVGGFSLGSGAWTGANTANGTFTGDIASVQVYNRVLSSGELFQNYLNQNETYNKLNTFNYTGAEQTYTVPSGTTKLGINLRGATGARGAFNQSGGGGANVFTTLSVSSGQQLTLVVGGSASSGTPAYGFGGAGGFASGNVYIAGAGGGMAGVFTSGSINISGTIVVAAGGGGGAGINRAGYNYTGGDASLSLLSGGRGADGNEPASEIANYGHNAGYGATTSGGGARGVIYDANTVQPSSGILFSGGNGGIGNGSNGGGGGGAGYYGGGGGAGGGFANGGGGAGSTFFASGTLTYGGLNYSGHAKISIQAFA